MKLEQRSGTVKVVVATTVMLSFISFWRAAAIVLADMASSAYYVGGIAENLKVLLRVAVAARGRGVAVGFGLRAGLQGLLLQNLFVLHVAILIDHWFARARPQISSSPGRSCRYR